ncbi:MAG: exosortase/archaeosortase family protein [Verrucomicrobia bacterium]|nr:exosortase/archaeosortase family protein [Verrucomicrobiota bacterium]
MNAPHYHPPFSALNRAVRISLVLLVALAATLIYLLWPHWRQNPDLSHGFFMPVIFLLLLAEARRSTARYLPAFAGQGLVVTGLLLAALLALAAGGLYAATLSWSHDLVAFTLTVAFVLFLGAALTVLASDPVRWIPLNWAAATAAGLWLLCAPIPPGTYSRLTLGLQLMVSENVLRTLHLLGIAAQRQGNIIQLATATVGVEEACSGVRSLVSCVFAGWFFSAMLVRRPASRAWLVVLAAPLALGMNFLRSLTLTLLANRGISIGGTWHDVTGFAVLGVTAVLLAGLAYLLEGAPAQPATTAERPAPQTYPPFRPHTSSLPRQILAVGLLVALALVALFVVGTRPAVRADSPAPDLAAVLPAAAPGWEVNTNTDLYRFSETLHTELMAQRTYTRPSDHGGDIVIVYLAYWRPGQASVSLVASHTPDACWPGSGWDAQPVARPRVRLPIGDRTLADAEMREFTSRGRTQNVWYWHLYDGHPLAHENPNSPRELLRLAWHYGFRRSGDQLFVRISSNRPWEEIRHEPFMESLFTRLQPMGL